jgi:O-methyltransferase domain
MSANFDPQERMARMLSGYVLTQLVYVMARLKLADLLSEGPRTVDELSFLARTRRETMPRLMRGLAGVGLVALEEDGRVSLTELGALLDSRAEGSMRDWALHRGGESYAAWGKLEHSVRTGESGFEAAMGAPFFSYVRDNPEAGAAFDGAMTGLSADVVRGAVERYDFAAATRILDVGGGRGHFAAAVLEEHQALEGAVFDVPEVADTASDYLRARGLGDRGAAIGGNFFESLPAGYDLHILKWILHDWNDESCRRLLAACRAALPEHGRLLIVERLLPDAVPDYGPLHPAIHMDLVMLVIFGDARERHLTEYEELLESTGFTLHEVVPLPAGFSVLDCRPRVAAAQARQAA